MSQIPFQTYRFPFRQKSLNFLTPSTHIGLHLTPISGFRTVRGSRSAFHHVSRILRSPQRRQIGMVIAVEKIRNQSIQSINQSINQLTSRRLNQSINQSIYRPLNQSINQSTKATNNKSKCPVSAVLLTPSPRLPSLSPLISVEYPRLSEPLEPFDWYRQNAPRYTRSSQEWNKCQKKNAKSRHKKMFTQSHPLLTSSPHFSPSFFRSLSLSCSAINCWMPWARTWSARFCVSSQESGVPSVKRPISFLDFPWKMGKKFRFGKTEEE